MSSHRASHRTPWAQQVSAAELPPRLASVCQQLAWVVDGENAPEDFLAWALLLERTDAAILDDRNVRALVTEARIVVERHVTGATTREHCIDRLAGILRRACDPSIPTARPLQVAAPQRLPRSWHTVQVR